MLRGILRALGLSQEAVDDIIDYIVGFLSGDNGKEADKPEFPYQLHNDFLSAAEQSFYLVLRSVVADRALICAKVSLGDLFTAKVSDQSQYRTYTNKIDRKHVDFLLCDLQTAKPLVGIELDDRSHQRADRQARDKFVNGVFAAARLPLIRVPVRRGYQVSELVALFSPYLPTLSAREVQPVVSKITSPVAATTPAASAVPKCPKCGGEMVLRTAKSGANAGNQFWGCSNYPQCKSMLKYEG
jgi:predicted RNA-binding Zn-ribbon protein involved in translation (DUF1610 family)